MGEGKFESIESLLDQFKSKNILVIGDVILDENEYTKPIGLSLETPTLKTIHIKITYSLGGAGNVWEHIKALGADGTLLTIVGNDKYGQMIHQLGKMSYGKNLIVDEGRKTIAKRRIWVGNDRHMQINHQGGNPISKKSWDEMFSQIEGLIPEYDTVLIADYQHGIFNPERINDIISLSHENNKKVFATSQMSQRIPDYLIYKKADLISMNEAEAKVIDDSYDNNMPPDLYAKELGTNLCVTFGEDGSVFYKQNGSTKGNIKGIHSPGLKMNPVDTTGAGDAHYAALSLGNVFEYPWESQRIANLWAALSVEMPGTKTPELNKLETLVKND